ncbi:hypothetical protein CkaCkLH20_00525 [Colletotrichum karsti]|uniref:Uncharacterized protein n=1 Tax=Colletotrichum karsti TaxID=1095194 RepID=A0A9P6IH61_9PEZI|nr:uncharacterized protein CkaCkLH20_00525 [Colletotrichum karsti]KAF9882489.1 hypothetical protein CkaCkLH20_00525 [Colletotrichum karsti]
MRETLLRRYSRGKIIDLWPYPNPRPPYGSPNFPRLEPSSYDAEPELNDEFRIIVQVEDHIAVAADRGSQIVLARVVHLGKRRHPDMRCEGMPLPSRPKPDYPVHTDDLIALNFFDHAFFKGSPSMSPAQRADSCFARQAYPLRYLYEAGGKRSPPGHKGDFEKLTGGRCIVPEFYGTWATFVDDGAGQRRFVSVVATEYIQGKSIADMCDELSYVSDNYLIPRPRAFFPRFRSDEAATLRLHEGTRLAILQDVIRQLANHIHLGVKYNNMPLSASDIVVTMYDKNGQLLDKPRAVLFKLTNYEVWETTQDHLDSLEKFGIDSPNHGRDTLEITSRPIHPYEMFCAYSVVELAGWFPSLWMENPYMFDAWLLKVFGAFEYGDHRNSSGKYSTFAELDSIEDPAMGEYAVQEEKERKERFSKAIACFKKWTATQAWPPFIKPADIVAIPLRCREKVEERRVPAWKFPAAASASVALQPAVALAVRPTTMLEDRIR